MTETRIPSFDEVVLGAFLEDIGKFMQRAGTGNNALPQEVMNRASVVLPSFQGRSSHWHALWTDAFFHELERSGSTLPGGLGLSPTRDAAVYHHAPSTPLQWLSAEADRLSAGMDRKPRDEEAELAAGGARGAFRKTPLRSIFATVDLGHDHGRDSGEAANYRVAELFPDALFPTSVAGEDQARGYAELWPRFFEGFVSLCREAPNVALFHEGLLSLSERFTWGIPSSTVDQPDVPLHDHNKSVAAVAACLYRFHEFRGELDDESAVRNRDVPKFRFLVGDLSGIQSSLFRLASQQVKGAARILRARSFLMAATVEAVSLACRRALGLPPYCELLAAGGRFLLIVPAIRSVEDEIERLRQQSDSWLVDRYLGDLTLNLALGRPLSGHDLMQGRFRDARADAEAAIARAKLNPLATVATGVLAVEYEAEADGACAACGVRPATRTDGETKRCVACHDAHEIGSRLPRAEAVVLSEETLHHGGGGVSIAMPDGLRLTVLADEVRADDRDFWRRILSGYRLSATNPGLLPIEHRFANHVPRLDSDAAEDPRYRDLDDESRAGRGGDIKTFAHIAADSREVLPGGGLMGRPMLAVLKADVDRLGQIFSRGLGEDMSLGRLATLSRMTDAFFTIVLPDLLRRDFPDTYTVYAGGDDLLLLGPWYEMVRLADGVAAAFHSHVGGNPDITISAGIELCGAHEPIGRAVMRAEHRLEAAKDAGRSRVSAIARTPVAWPQLADSIADADRISAWMRDDRRPLATAFVYRSLTISRLRDRADSGEVGAANWRARWAYSIGRNLDRKRDEERLRFFDRLLGSRLTGSDAGPPEAAPTALTIALYRNR